MNAMVLFWSEEHIEKWCKDWNLPRGEVSAIDWRRLGTAPTAVSLSGGGEQLTKLRHCLRNLALYQSSGTCHVDAA